MHENPLSDAELLRVFAEPGHESAWTQLVERFRALLFAVCFRILHDRQLAEDAVQEAWERVVLNKHTYNGQHTVGAWLVRIARNSAIDQHRRVHVRQKHTGGDYTFVENASPVAEDHDDVDDDQPMTRLEEEIRRLPVAQQAVLLLVSHDNRTRPGLGYATLSATAEALDYCKAKDEPDHNRVYRLLGSAYETLRWRLSENESTS